MTSILESTSNKTYVEQSLVGKVKWFNVKAGFGFINRYLQKKEKKSKLRT